MTLPKTRDLIPTGTWEPYYDEGCDRCGVTGQPAEWVDISAEWTRDSDYRWLCQDYDACRAREFEDAPAGYYLYRLTTGVETPEWWKDMPNNWWIYAEDRYTMGESPVELIEYMFDIRRYYYKMCKRFTA